MQWVESDFKDESSELKILKAFTLNASVIDFKSILTCSSAIIFDRV